MSGWGFQRVAQKKPQQQYYDDDDENSDESNQSNSLKKSRSTESTNSPQKINAIMEDLSHDLHKFGRRVHKLQQFTKDIGTSRDNDKLRSKLKAERTHAAKVNDRIQKNLNKLTRSLLEGTDVSKAGSNSSDILDPSSLSYRRQQLKKLKTQAQDMERQYNEALKESVSKEKKHQKRNTIDDYDDDDDAAATQNGTPTDDLYEDLHNNNEDEKNHVEEKYTSTTRAIIREQSKQNMEKQKEKKPTQQQQQQQQLNKQIKLVLSSSDKSTMDVEHMIAAETLRELQELETNYAELHECFTDLNGLIKEQDGAFNVILTNVEQANKNVEMGVEEIKIAKGYTAVGGIQKLTSKISNLGKFL